MIDITKAFRDIVTGKDNQTHDLGRWSWIVTTSALIGAAAWNAWHGAVLDLMMIANAFGLNIGAHGAVLWAKRGTEPDPGAQK
jgi:hypothetical protein